MTIDTLSITSIVKSRTAGAVVVNGTTTPNAAVVVENQSLATFAPAKTADAFVHGKADAAGHFAVEVKAAHEGDHLRVRSDVSGRMSVVGVRVQHIAAIDGRPPVMHQQGLRLVDKGDGSFRFSHAQRSDVVGEPTQQLRFKNARSGAHDDVVLDADGRLPKDASVRGKSGDSWSLATSDGAHNTKFVDTCGTLMAPVPGKDPPVCVGDTGTLKTLSGPLFACDPAVGAVVQGAIGDCWLVSAVDAIANVAPLKLRELFTENDDGTVTVSFSRFDHDTGRVCKQPITVDNTAYAKGGELLYGTCTGEERWFVLLEKAYASWKGGYDAVVSGYPFEAFEAVLGKPGKHFDLDISSTDAVWSALKKPDRVLATWSRVESKDLRFANTGLQADHAYAVVGVDENDGERFVTLRNPWGQNGWAARGGPLDLQAGSNGLLSMKLDVFMKFFAGLGSVDPR